MKGYCWGLWGEGEKGRECGSGFWNGVEFL